MKVEIKSRWDWTVLFTAEAASFHLALEAAVKSGANLSGANLSGADLSRANLYGANLSGADLSRANVYGANVYGADLSGADLYGADLSGANLSGADLSGANLSGANLSGANLSGANLSGADLSRANVYGANLSGANLSGAKNSELVQARTAILPEGNLVGWKKLRGGIIAKLLIPQKAKRSNATGRKCRADFVKVLRLFGGDSGVSIHDGQTTYRKGETVTCDKWNEDRFEECSGGIHFYITRLEAEAHE